MTTRHKPKRRNSTDRTRRSSPPVLPDRRLMEQQMQTIGRLLEGREFGSIEDVNAYLDSVIGEGEGQLPVTEPRTPLERAQAVVYEALEARGQRRIKLARQALAISAECADAYVLLADVAQDPHEIRSLYEQAVQAGERALGPQVFAESVGHFWGMIETRPYMRARRGLAEVLWAVGERQAAISHLQDLLRLNPGDNQGVRYPLVTWLLGEGNIGAAERLLEQYPDEVTASWAYTRALVLFRRRGASKQADQALVRALEINPFVPQYLVGAKRPTSLPEFVGIGDENEAIDYVAGAHPVWLDQTEAVDWLVAVIVRHLPRLLASQGPTPSPRIMFPR
jgi:tetratricopeptide (TPR) repeat protein